MQSSWQSLCSRYFFLVLERYAFIKSGPCLQRPAVAIAGATIDRRQRKPVLRLEMKIARLVCIATALIAASAAAQNGDKPISNPASNPASKTSISFATATPGGGFPLYGNALAEVMNAAD